MTGDLSLSGQTALVTGAGGFIGPALCRRLCELGADVHAVSRRRRDGAEPPWTWRSADLSDMTVARDLFAEIKPQFIFHLAGHAAGGRDLGLVLPTFTSNLATTVNVLVAAAEKGCTRLLLANSMEEPAPGDATAIPSSPYAVSKWASGAYGRMFHALYDLPVVLLRVFMTYGPGHQDLRKLIPHVTLALLREESPVLAGGERRIDWIFVEDVVDAFIAAAVRPDLEGLTIDVGSGELVSVREIVEHLVGLTGCRSVPRFGALPERRMEQVRAADAEKTYATLGFRPRVNLRDGLARTIGWYRERLTMADL